MPASLPAVVQGRGERKKQTRKKKKKGKIQIYYLKSAPPTTHGVASGTGKHVVSRLSEKKSNLANNHYREPKRWQTLTMKRWEKIIRLESELSIILDQLYDL